MLRNYHVRIVFLLLSIFVLAAVPLVAQVEDRPFTPGSGTLIRGTAPEGGTVITDESRIPTSFNEAPMLAERVAAGDLPPLEERLPAQPLVIEPLEAIGTYGGTLQTVCEGSNECMNRMMPMDKLVYWNATNTELVPSVARAWEMSDDDTVLTFFLREGMLWSDGAPFTSEDIRFWWEDIHLNTEITANIDLSMVTEGGPAQLEIVDEHTFRFVFADPYPAAPEAFAAAFAAPSTGSIMMVYSAAGPYQPAHYLRQFHPDYADPAELDAMIAEAGVEGWVPLYNQMLDWANNPELPLLSPWVTVEPKSTGVWRVERNPYFWEVDTAGNQLPYIDAWTIEIIEDAEVRSLRVIAGESDFDFRAMNLPDLIPLVENAEQNGYNVYLDYSPQGMNLGFAINQSYEGDDYIAELLRTVDFRRALSLAIDRNQFNEAFFLGMGLVGSPVIAEASPQNPGPEYRTLWSVQDIDQANALLDAIGLDERDSEGFRLRTDTGERVVIELMRDGSATTGEWPAAFEMFAEQISTNIGIQVDIDVVGTAEALERRDNDTTMMTFASNQGSDNLFQDAAAIRVFPGKTPNLMGNRIARWVETNGAEGIEPQNPELLRVIELYQQGLTATQEQRIENAQEIWRIVIDQVYNIGIVGGATRPRVLNASLGNVPDSICFEARCRFPGSMRTETLFWRQS